MSLIPEFSGMFQDLYAAQNRRRVRSDSSVPGLAKRPQDEWHPLLQQVMKTAGDATGVDMQTSQGAMGDLRKNASGLNMNNPQDILKLSQMYQGLGDTGTALSLAQQAQQAQTLAAEKARIENQRISLMNQVPQLGLSEDESKQLKTEIATASNEGLESIRKELYNRALAKSDVIKTAEGRKVIGKNLGWSQEDIEAGADMTPDQFSAFRESMEADLQAFQTPEGVVLRRVTSGGLIHTAQGLKRPEQLQGWREAPEVQEVISRADTLAEEVTKSAAKRYSEVHQWALDAEKSIQNLKTSWPLLENAYDGTLAETKLAVAKVAKMFGYQGEDDSIEATEAYMADRAKEVAVFIKNLGAGTGLSDADREYAKQVVAGNIKMDKESMKKVMALGYMSSVNAIRNYNTIQNDLSTDPNTATAFSAVSKIYRPIAPAGEVPQEVYKYLDKSSGPQFNSSAQKYLGGK